MVTNITKEVAKILKDNKKPMTFKQIYKISLKRGKLKLKGLTPIASICAKITSDIKHNGSQSQFIKIKTGLYDLNRQKIK